MTTGRRISRSVPGWTLLLAWVALIFWLSVIPSPPRMDNALFGWDKFQHAAAYGVLTVLAGFVYVPLSSGFLRGWIAAAGFAVAYGAFMEVVQLLFTVRSAELVDVAADAVGAVVAVSAAFGARSIGLYKN